VRRLPLLLLLALLLVAGCSNDTSTQDSPAPEQASAPAETRQTGPTTTEALRKEAGELAGQGDYTGAETKLREAIRLDPQAMANWNDLAFVLLQAKRYSEAAEAAKQALSLDQADPAARFNLGLAYYRQEQYAAALPHLEFAYSQNQQQVEPGWFLALTLEKVGKPDQALTTLNDLAERFPADPDLPKEIERLVALNSPAVWTLPGGRNSFVAFLGDRLITRESHRLIATDQVGAQLWEVPLPGPESYIVVQPNGVEALVATPDGVRLIDLQSGQHSLIPLDRQTYGSDGEEWLHWRGRTLLWGRDQWGGTLSGSARYLSTSWLTYRLSPDHTSSQQMGEGFMGGQLAQVSQDGQVILIQGTPTSGAALYREGSPLHTFDQPGRYSLAPTGEHVLHNDYHGALTLYTANGTKLWLHQTGWEYASVLFWPTTGDNHLILVDSDNQYLLLDMQGKEITAGTGQFSVPWQEELPRTPHLLLRSGEEWFLLHPSGTTTTVHQGNTLTHDGQWVYAVSEAELRAYRP